nr:mvrA protein [Escherichia coli]
MNGRLLARHDVKGDNEENRRIGEQELARCKAMGIEAGKVLRLGDIARSDNVIFSATGITKGDLLEGISRKGNIATTETLLIRGKSRTIRRIQSIHYLDRKDPEMQVHTPLIDLIGLSLQSSGLEFFCSENEDKASQSKQEKNMADWVTGKVTKVQNWTDALFSLTVHAPVLPFTAGQFTKLGLEIDGERVQRAYSYVNSPDNPDLEFYLVTVPDGKLSPRLAALKPGDEVQVVSDAGFFVLDEVPHCKRMDAGNRYSDWPLFIDSATR